MYQYIKPQRIATVPGNTVFWISSGLKQPPALTSCQLVDVAVLTCLIYDLALPQVLQPFGR